VYRQFGRPGSATGCTPRETLQQDKELTPNNTAVGIIGPGPVHDDPGITVDCRILEGSLIEMYGISTLCGQKEHWRFPLLLPPPQRPLRRQRLHRLNGDDDVQMSEY